MKIHFERSASSFFATLKCNAIKEKKRKLESYNIGQGHCSNAKRKFELKKGVSCFNNQLILPYVRHVSTLIVTRIENLLGIIIVVEQYNNNCAINRDSLDFYNTFDKHIFPCYDIININIEFLEMTYTKARQ